MNDAILFAVRHSLWANEKLLRYCAGLTREQLDWTVPGTYGTVESILHHTVSADQGYVLSLTGTLPGEPRASTEKPGPIADLIPKVRAIGESCERLLSQPFDIDRVVVRPRGTATAGVLIAQLVHHGSDHRAHVGTILGAHGLNGDDWDLDLWVYGTELGVVKMKDA
jgi:uncharacterized damage-inducible protein DinB